MNYILYSFSGLFLQIPQNTLWCLCFILIVFVICLFVILRYKQNDTLLSNRRLVEYFPTLISTLGVLGTFYGITIGLIDFDTKDLPTSIPKLLDGLKTAFFTSLAGMIGSMILSAFISRFQDNKDGGVSDAVQAAATICQAVQQMSKLNTETMKAINEQLKNSDKDRNAFYRSMSDVMDFVKNSQEGMATNIDIIKTAHCSLASVMDSMLITARSQDSSLCNIKESNTAMLTSIGNIEESSTTQLGHLSRIDNCSAEMQKDTHFLGEMLETVESISTTQDIINDQVSKVKDIVHGEVIEIEENMEKTNKLLERKFDEFTELLKKSNTEALVEVMKKVTEEFQKQMNSLINKLIQENFDQLNKSVEKLNQWQQENKEMIASLTRQYKQMADNFEATSTSLTQVKEDTTMLVGEGGKLRQIVDALNRVIVEDEKFIKLTTELHETATLSKSNMESFDESTKALNEWVRKQRNFVESVQLLINKLEEIEKIKDYGGQFWRETKEKMEEGVGIISKGSQTLNQQLTSLDRKFYERLSATLAELDRCIASKIDEE